MCNTKTPIVSVIITNYNYRQYLDKCFTSVLNQHIGAKKIELIIVDDGSTDNSQELINRYCGKDMDFFHTTKSILKENGGTASARNAGIKIAKGKYIQILDADDYLLTESLSSRVNLAEKDDRFGLIYSDFNSYVESEDKYIREYRPHFDVFENVREYICGTNVFIPRKVFDHIGLYNSEYPTIEDYEMSLRISRQFFTVHIPEVHYVYRQTENQKTKRVNRESLVGEYTKLNELKQELFGSK